MAQQTVTIPAFRYAPGDGHVYEWDGASAIVVSRISHVGNLITLEATGDTIPAPANRTATAMMATVRAWAGYVA